MIEKCTDSLQRVGTSETGLFDMSMGVLTSSLKIISIIAS